MEESAKKVPTAQIAQKIRDAFPDMPEAQVSEICAIIADTCDCGQPKSGNPVELDIPRVHAKLNTIAEMVSQIHDATVIPAL